MTHQTIIEICSEAGITNEDLTINLENQNIYLPTADGNRRKSHKQKRTIYRARYNDNNRLLGDVLNRKPTGDPWPLVEYNNLSCCLQSFCQVDMILIENNSFFARYGSVNCQFASS